MSKTIFDCPAGMGLLPATNRQRPGILLIITLQHTRQPCPQRVIQSEMSTALRLRNNWSKTLKGAFRHTSASGQTCVWVSTDPGS